MTRRRRILFVDHTAVLGGGEIALLNLVRHLDRSRFIPTVLLCSEGPLVENLRQAGIPTHIIPLAPSIIHTRKGNLGFGSLFRGLDFVRLILYVVTLARFIRRNRFDLVHTNSLKADIIGGLAARLAGARLVWHVRDRIDDDYLPRPVVVIFRTLCRLIPDHVIAVSHATLATLDPSPPSPGRRPKASRRMHVVHDGIEGELFRDAAPTARNGVTRIGLVGRISPFKGQHVFLEAASTIRRRFPNAHFQIIGGALFAEDDYESRIRGMAAAPLLQNAVEFTGFRSDVPALISKLDILVHASTTGEPFGQVVVEGMAAGKPVVATRGGGVPEIVVDGVTGWLVPMADAPALAEAVCRLLQNPTAAADMGRRGQERALACFSVSSTAANVERLYTDHVFRSFRLRTTVPQEDGPPSQPLRVRPPVRPLRRDAAHRILIVSHSAAPSGAEMAMLNLCRHLDRRYYTPVVLFCSDGPMVAEFGRIGVETHVLRLAPTIINTRIRQLRLSSVFRLGDLANFIAYVTRLSRFIRFQRIACVHTNSLKSHVLGGMAAQLARVPVLWHVRNRIDSNYLPGPAAPFFRGLCRVVPDYVVSVSAAVRDLLRLRRGGHAAEGAVQPESSVVHDGVDHRRFGAEPNRTLSSPAVVGLVGRISPFKGQHIFLEAAAIVRQRFPNTQFQIVGATLFGEDDYARHLQTLCRTFALEDCVQFTGFEGDIPRALSRLDLVVHASTMGEPFGQVIIEAMAAGKPVVATDGGGVPEIIQHDVTGYLVPMEDATAMADAISRLLADPERAAEMGRRAQQRVKSHFTIEASASKLHDVYQHLLDRMTIRQGNDLIYRTSKPWAMSRIHGIFILLFAFLSLLYVGLLALD